MLNEWIVVAHARALRSERGQSTAEYALILVAVAVIAGVVIAYVGGPGSGLITQLFSDVFARLRGVVAAGG
jgi:Flp pilus assembly pilin Flp